MRALLIWTVNLALVANGAFMLLILCVFAPAGSFRPSGNSTAMRFASGSISTP